MSTEDYFSIDDILSAQPRVHATLLTPAHNLAHLDPLGAAAYWSSNPPPAATVAPTSSSSTVQDLPQGHRLALPFWLIESLSQRGLISVQLPRCFATQARHALRADARAVKLHARCPAYYALGVRLAALVKDVGLSAALVRAFAERCWGIVDSAVFVGARGVEALVGLDEAERALFFVAHGLEIAVRRWKERLVDRIGRGGASVLGKRSIEEVGSPVTPAAQRMR